MARRDTRIDVTPLRHFLKEMKVAIGGTTESGPIGRMFIQWGTRYLSFLRRRFQKQSRGGGEWPDLAESTKRKRARRSPARRRGRGRGRGIAGRVFSILRDEGYLFNALNIGSPGNVFQRIKSGVRVGFGGEARHPKGKISIRRLAEIHNMGEGHVPKRTIIVPPDEATVEGMKNDVRAAIRALGRESEMRSRK